VVHSKLTDPAVSLQGLYKVPTRYWQYVTIYLMEAYQFTQWYHFFISSTDAWYFRINLQYDIRHRSRLCMMLNIICHFYRVTYTAASVPY